MEQRLTSKRPRSASVRMPRVSSVPIDPPVKLSA